MNRKVLLVVNIKKAALKLKQESGKKTSAGKPASGQVRAEGKSKGISGRTDAQ